MEITQGYESYWLWRPRSSPARHGARRGTSLSYCRVPAGSSSCFFFSSRRRHTRYIGDWSSDVCSSDLLGHRVLPHLADRDVAVALLARSSRLGRAARRGDRRSVHVRRVDAVEVILQHQLPVAVVRVLEDPAGDFQLAARRAVDQIVERALCRSEELLQARARGGEGSEDEAAVGRNPRDAAQAELLAPAGRIARRHGNGAQAAVGVVSPAEIGRA